MAADIVDIADAIVTDLNDDPATNFGISFTAVRSEAEWDDALESEGDPQVDVVPAGHPRFSLAERPADPADPADVRVDHQVEIQVILRQRFRKGSDKKLPQSSIDTLRLATQKIAKRYLGWSPTSTATWVPTAGDKPIEADGVRAHFRQHHQYTGIVKLTYEVVG